MSMEKIAAKPFYSEAPLDVDFQKRLKSVVVTDLDMLEKICSQENKVVAFDTETTGLVYYKDYIVGCSISFNSESGFYVPLRHVNEDNTPAEYNLPIKDSLHLIYEKLLKRNQIVLYNSCFDLTMIGQELEKIGLEFTDIEEVSFLDAMCMVYFLEPEIKKNGLKWAARHFLGRISPEFSQVLGVKKKTKKIKEKNFGHINPWSKVLVEPEFIELKGAKKKLTEADIQHNEDMLKIGAYETTGAIYAVNDAVNTYGLYKNLSPVIQNMQQEHNKLNSEPFAFITDSRLAKAMLHYKHTPISIDNTLMKECLGAVEKKIEETESKIFEIAGKPFNLSSTPQKREVFKSLGISTGVETKTGMSVSVSALANCNHPIIDLMTERSHLEKRRSAYFEPLSKEQISRINYKTCAVSTGRLSSGKGNEVENVYFSSISVQTLPKPSTCLYEAVYVGEDDQESILGYKFHPVTSTYAEGNPDKTYVEGFKQELNVRNALCSPHKISVETPTEKLDFGFDILRAEKYIRDNNLEPERLICEKSNDWYVCSLDISAEELAIIANLSKEPNFVEPLLKREDLHYAMAAKMFPEFANADKAAQKNLRKKAKSGNFGLAYRGSHLALRDIEDEEEKLKIYNAWWSNMPIYRQWQQERINEMTMLTGGDAINHYGRMRRLGYLLMLGKQSYTNSAIRQACNHYVQGLGADYIRICMSKFYEEILRHNENFNEIRFLASIHDELAFAIRKDVLDKWLFKVMTIMETSYPKDFIVPFISCPQIGTSFGYGFDFDYDRDPETFKLIPGSKLKLKV